MDTHPFCPPHHALTEPAARLDALLPCCGYLPGAVLSLYFWASALTKLGDGIFGFCFHQRGLCANFPHAMENVGYDPSALGLWHWAVVTAGTWAEIILPLTILIGLFTRLSALSDDWVYRRAIIDRSLWSRACGDAKVYQGLV